MLAIMIALVVIIAFVIIIAFVVIIVDFMLIDARRTHWCCRKSLRQRL